MLKKQPNFHCAKVSVSFVVNSSCIYAGKIDDGEFFQVLKGLGLLRLGREEECEAILEEVKKDLPAEDTTLQAMSICYKEMHRCECHRPREDTTRIVLGWCVTRILL